MSSLPCLSMQIRASARSGVSNHGPTVLRTLRYMNRTALKTVCASQTMATAAAADAASASADSEYEFTLPQDSFQTHHFETPPLVTRAKKSELLSLYNQMLAIRRLETACDQLYKSKLIRGRAGRRR